MLIGERFVKWTLDADGMTDVASAIETGENSKGVPNPITVHAQYDPASNPGGVHSVALDPNGGRVSAESIMIQYQAKPYKTYSEIGHYDKGAAGAPVRVGYEFAGWYTAKTGGSKITENTKVSKYVDHVVYARWTANKYWITFNVNDGVDYMATPPAAKTFAYGSAYKSLPTPKRAGYTFAGWYFDADDGGSIYDIPVNKNTIVGNVMDGNTIVVDITTGFAGWVGDTNYTKTVNQDAVILHAKWTPSIYKITLNVNGGTYGAGLKTAKVNGTFGEQYVFPEMVKPSALTPPKNKTTFLGWYTAKTGGVQITDGSGTLQPNAIVKTAKAHTLFAQWE